MQGHSQENQCRECHYKYQIVGSTALIPTTDMLLGYQTAGIFKVLATVHQDRQKHWENIPAIRS